MRYFVVPSGTPRKSAICSCVSSSKKASRSAWRWGGGRASLRRGRCPAGTRARPSRPARGADRAALGGAGRPGPAPAGGDGRARAIREDAPVRKLQEPGTERSLRRVEAGGPPPHRQEDLLDDLLGRALAERLRRQVEDERGVAAVQRRERVLLPGARRRISASSLVSCPGVYPGPLHARSSFCRAGPGGPPCPAAAPTMRLSTKAG